jgi:hypothetical protein
VRLRLLKLGDTQRLVFQQLVLQDRTIPASDPPHPATAALRAGIDELTAKGSRDPLSWLELYDLESMIIRLLDDNSLRNEAWSLREEFRNLATEELYKAYVDSNPPHPAEEPDGRKVRRDIEGLLRKLHELRLGRSLLDVIRAYTTALTFAVTLALIVTTVVACFRRSDPPVLLLVTIGGVFGAGLSMLQRLSQIPSKGDLVARHPAASRRVVWILTPLLALSQGALAAIVLYHVFRAGLLEGLMFPDFRPAAGDAAKPTTRPLAELLHGGVTSSVQGAKLFVWSLAAGTAERLVPDLLSRLSDQANRSKLASEKPA